MRGFAVLLAFWLLGELAVRLSGVPVPGQVAGMVMLLIALLRGWIKPEWIRDAADLLLSRMMLFFAPVIVGVTAFYPLLKMNWLPVAGAIVPGTLLVLAAAGAASAIASRRRRAERERSHVGP